MADMCVRGRGHGRAVAGGLLAATVLMLILAGCQLSANGTQTNLVVDFNTQASGPRDVVRTHCGALPGVMLVPARAKDVSVYFSIQHATNRQVNALDTCVNNLQTADPSLGIRGYRITDGTDS